MRDEKNKMEVNIRKIFVTNTWHKSMILDMVIFHLIKLFNSEISGEVNLCEQWSGTDQ